MTPWTAACQASLSFTISWSLLKLRSIDSMMLSNHLILYCSLLHPSIFPSMRIFSNELAFHIWWPNIGASASVLQMNIQGWFPLGLTDFTFLQSKGLSRVFSNTLAGSFSKWRGSELCCLKRKSRKLKSFLLGSDGKHFRIAKNTGSRVRQTWGWWHRQDKALEPQVQSLQHGNSKSTFLREQLWELGA